MRNCVQNKRGFTLVEMALVLVVIGIVIGIGAGMIGPLMSLSKTRETKEFLGSAVESVNSWAASNNRLPDVTAGTTGFRSVAKTPTDAWGRDLIYLYDSNFIAASKDTICGRKTTLITLRQCLTANCATTSGTDYIDMSNVAYVVFSQGDDATTQTASTDAAVTISRQFTPGVAARVTLDMNHNDIVRWVTLDELRSKIGCQGAQLKIVNNELPPGTVSAQYPNATVGSVLSLVTDGGATPGTLRWCIEAPSANPLPAGLIFTPALAGAIRVAPNTCNAINPLPEAGWILSPTLNISGTPAANSQGAYNFTLYVRDNNDTASSNDNIASKTFVLTVNP
ncbi:MAG: prepilin-type N-terminal cleavage/methylation domain-containing protein [Trichlorobacter sp.]|uniref:putative Ig domain-containing protein n=1 Tax=Trichlorobacter sp. TaxID=2911007 RepID=UPI00256D694F|nr:putative Ig domain-containing protein [Trichlorobacter sp.]MDK9719126.1 prepilin-type N-terminal cleavage/methylation domain-containing protein [Trichlorobacter sp.]